MGKNKNKNKGNGGVQTSSTPAVATPTTLTIVVDSEVEKEQRQKYIEMADQYSLSKHEEADQYYATKKKEADALRGQAEAEIERRVAEAVAQERKRMKQEIADAEQEAKDIIKKAKADAASLVDQLEERRKELDEKLEAYTRDIALLEATKASYKEEVLRGIQKEIQKISAEKDRLEAAIEDLKKQLKKEKAEKDGLAEDMEFLQSEIDANQVKRSEVASYRLQIETLQTDYNRLNDFYNDQKAKLEELKSQILMYGDDPSKAMRENAELQKKIEELESLISSCPSAEELQKLRETSAKYAEILVKLESLEAERLALETENIELKVNKDEIESYRRFIKILELQKAELQRELDRNIELYNSRTEKVFASLSLIDSMSKNDYPSIAHNWNLKKLCEAFRGYLANRPKNPLYYDERTIRTFIAGFASSRLMILEGLSGTGKSSLPRAFADFMGSHTIEVPVQSSWKDRNDLLGFYNDFKKQYKETEFLKALYTATSDPNNIYVIVLDEMNLSRIEYYFADLLSVLEKPDVEDWKIELISDYASITSNQDAWPKLISEGKLQIGDNTWFVGTANRDDSTFIITDKVYDRSVVLTFDKKGKKGKVASAQPIKMNNEDFQRLLARAERFTDAKSEERFRKMLSALDEQVRELFQITFGNRIAHQLEKFVPVYLACGGTVDEAVDVMFSRKVLRKLEGIYDENTKENLELLKDEIELQEYNLPITVEAITRMTEKM